MSRVSYQAMLDSPAAARAAFVPPEGITTRRKDATTVYRVKLSRRQASWLRGVAGTHRGVDADAVVRAAIDLVMELEVDWGAIGRTADVRAAVRDAVLVRRRDG